MVKQVRAVRTRQSLILAAAEVFTGDGYAKASLHAISRRAGVSSGALHFHFPNKDALARQVECAAASLVEELVETSRSAADTALQSLVNTTSSVLRAAASDPVVRAGFRLSGDPSRSGAELLRWWGAIVGDLVEQARRTGELAGDVSPKAATGVILAATVGLETLSLLEADWLSQDCLGQFWNFVLPRLAATSL